MMNQVDAELGYSGRPALMQQQPATVTDDTISGADLVCHAVLSFCYHTYESSMHAPVDTLFLLILRN